MEHKFKVGDKVLYKGIIGEVDRLSETFSGELTVGLTSIEDEVMTCTAIESECEFYDEEIEVDTMPLIEAQLNSKRIQNMVGGLTDKYFRDGNH